MCTNCSPIYKPPLALIRDNPTLPLRPALGALKKNLQGQENKICILIALFLGGGSVYRHCQPTLVRNSNICKREPKSVGSGTDQGLRRPQSWAVPRHILLMVRLSPIMYSNSLIMASSPSQLTTLPTTSAQTLRKNVANLIWLMLCRLH